MYFFQFAYCNCWTIITGGLTVKVETVQDYKLLYSLTTFTLPSIVHWEAFHFGVYCIQVSNDGKTKNYRLRSLKTLTNKNLVLNEIWIKWNDNFKKITQFTILLNLISELIYKYKWLLSVERQTKKELYLITGYYWFVNKW